MRVWPKSGWIHAVIAAPVSVVISYFVFIHTENSSFALAVKGAPHDGLDGLSAFSDGLEAGLAAMAGSFLVLFLLQRYLTSPNSKS